MFDFNPNDVQVGFPVFPKNDYDFEVGEPKPFFNEYDKEDGSKQQSYGVAYMLKCVSDGPMKGKPFYQRCDVSQDMSRQGTKRFQMAALGYKTDDEGEKKFNEFAATQDWKFDPDAKTVGEGWQSLKGKIVKATLEPVTIKKGAKAGELGNGFPQFRSYNS